MSKKFVLIMTLSMALIGLWAGNWQTITNSSHIFDLLVDNNQVIFSTWGGVVRYDEGPILGRSTTREYFEHYTTGDGIVSNDIRCMEKVGDDLWLGSSNSGISIISPQGIRTLDVALGLPSLSIRAIRKVGSRILVATSGGIAEYYYLEGVAFPLLLNQYRNENTDGGLISNDVQAMATAANGYLYFGTPSGISYVHQDSLAIDTAWRIWNQSNSPMLSGYDPLLEANTQYLILRNANRILRHSIDPGSGAWEVLDIGEVEEPIAAIQIDPQNRIWLSFGNWDEDLISYTTTGDILMRVVGTDKQITDYSKNELGLGTKSITRIRVDAGGNAWLGSWGEGFYMPQGTNNWSAVSTESVGFPKIAAAATDSQHNLWFVSGYIDAEPVRKGSLGVCYFDGVHWVTKNVDNSHLHNDSVHSLTVDGQDRVWFGAWDVSNASPDAWRNGITIYDKATDTWKYLTMSGMRNWNPDSNDWGALIPGAAGLLGNTIGGINMDLNGNIFVACYDRGFTVIRPDDTLLTTFTIPNSVHQKVMYSYHNGRQYFFGTNNDNGLVIWNDNSIPDGDGDKWYVPEPSELSNCQIYGIASIESAYTGWQHWIAASNGLFMWDETDWYKYDTSVKRFIYNRNTHIWNDDQYYYADEERLFGSVRTTPTAIYKDPFGRIWIGSLENGLTMYDPETDRFTNYYLPKDPLLTNYVLSLTYEPVNGLLWIGSSDGLNTLRIGRAIKPDTKLETVKAFPNPFRPESDGTVQIVNLPLDSMPRGKNQCRIYDSSGALVIKLEESVFARFAWDGKNDAGKKVASGIYYYVVADDMGNVRRGKIALIR